MAKLEVEISNISKMIRDRATDAVEKVTGETEKIVQMVKERGEKTQQEGKKQLDRLVSQMRKSDVVAMATDMYGEVEKLVEENVVKLLQFLQIPTRDQLDKLTKRVNKLSEQMGGLHRGGKRGSSKRALRTGSRKSSPRGAGGAKVAAASAEGTTQSV